MPASGFEIEEAEMEGIQILHRLGPKRILGHARVEGVETLAVKSVFDPDGSFNPRFLADTESSIECDSVILAIGQSPDLSWLRPEDGVEVSPRGTIDVDAETLATSAPGIYAGGDVAFGPRNLIDAIRDGRRAAASIHGLLGGAAPGPRRVQRALPVASVPRPVLDYDATPRVEIPSVSTDRRVGVPEIELGYDEGRARLEAARCLQCFYNIMLDPSLCILCGGCVDICPENCLRVVPAEDLDGMTAAGPSGALILQEDRCIRCALCIERCPTGALFMTGWAEASIRLPGAEPRVGGAA